MEGTIETSSMNFQARTSYLTNEVLWGQRFEPMTLYRKDHNKFQVNFSAFNSTYEVETPLCSAKELDNYNSNNLLRQQRARLSMNHIPRPPPSVMADHQSQFGDHPVHHQPYSQPPHYPGYNSYLISPEHIHRSASVSSRQAPPVNHQESPGFNHQQTAMPVTSPPPLHSLDSDSSIDMSTKKEKFGLKFLKHNLKMDIK
ncbi:inward rectifier potassium channel irk-1 [Eurytemora carolleeae]|uniref:inward rectifier potassium channel irk-1 n=1 Tax=Eurytemora carolleeae TaxID=1294199 RepID=UPI000C7560BD|nr:inward rectifier potassium channel irk-1 [Eurytemora carolleeae]|eukprot:XP_023348960.1 inward rectifier potassium channel irk-1-like [Eurytemora affinis]